MRVLEAAGGLLDSLERRSFQRIGLGRVGDRHFLFHCGVGFDAAVVEAVERRSAFKRYAAHPLFVAAAYFKDRGETHRKKVLVPDSAHGTNPASAASPIAARHRVDIYFVMPQAASVPASMPRRNAATRCAEDPCVKASGRTGPPDIFWMLSSPMAAAALSTTFAIACSSSSGVPRVGFGSGERWTSSSMRLSAPWSPRNPRV